MNILSSVLELFINLEDTMDTEYKKNLQYKNLFKKNWPERSE